MGKGSHFSNYKENNYLLNIYVPNKKSSKYTNQRNYKTTQRNRQIHNYITLSIIDRI